MRGHRYAGWLLAPEMARHFGGSKVPSSPPPSSPPPKLEDKSVQEAAAKERRLKAKRAGRGGTMLSGDTLGEGATLG